MDPQNFMNQETLSALITRGIEAGTSIALAALILIVGMIVAGTVRGTIRKAATRSERVDDTLGNFFASLAYYGIMAIVLIAVLNRFGVETTSMVAALGAATLAIGLALQGTLSNVAAGVMLLFLRPFQAGDWIETSSHSGTVAEIGLFTTIITTFDNVFISVPNSAIWGATVTNHSRNTTRRMDIDIGIAYSSDLDLAEKIMLSLAGDDRVLASPEPQFLVVNYADSAIIVRLRLHAHYDDFFKLYWDLMRQLKPALDQAGIEIPFPQREIRSLGNDTS